MGSEMCIRDRLISPLEDGEMSARKIGREMGAGPKGSAPKRVSPCSKVHGHEGREEVRAHLVSQGWDGPSKALPHTLG